MRNQPNDTVLRVEGISKRFPGVLALDNVSMELQAGKVCAIIGENGAGKSTLMKILSGIYQDYEGELILNNEEIRFANPKQAQDAGIAIIHQELNLIPYLSVRENIFLGREITNRFGILDKKEMNSRTIDILKKLKQEIPPDTLISAIKVGQQQIIEIARALMFDARLIIMDEPTSALSDKEVEVLFEIIRGLRSNRKAIAYISHKLEELTGISDQYIILRDGVLVDSGEMTGMSHEDIIQKMVGRGIRQAGRTSESSSEEVCLKVENISLSHSELPGAYLVHPISFSLFKGEILGVFGLMGAGRTELLETIFGLHPGRSSGEISINGKPCSFRSPSDAIRAGIGLVPEDRKNDGLVPGMDIKMNISLSSIENIEVNGILSTKEERKLSRKYIEELGIKTPSGDQKAGNLSGGNQQKTILAKWLATHPSILLLDEPTRGIDINAKNEIYKLILKLCSEGMGIVMVSSELPEILAISNRILVLSEGRLSGEFKAGEVSEEQIMKAAIPRRIKSVV